MFDLSTSLAPTTTSEARYRKAAKSLLSYNQRLANGGAVFERRADNLLATLDRFALDMGASSATLDRRITEHAGDWIDTTADDIFYGIKGPSAKATPGDSYWPACVLVQFITGKAGTRDTVSAIRSQGQTVGSCWIRECAGTDCRKLGREEIPRPCGGREYPPRSERR